MLFRQEVEVHAALDEIAVAGNPRLGIPNDTVAIGRGGDWLAIGFNHRAALVMGDVVDGGVGCWVSHGCMVSVFSASP